jgi:flavin-dependent dehydrogenase
VLIFRTSVPYDPDLLILGAGPAGCAAALKARQAGLRVILVEAAAKPLRKPGETLHPGVEPLFKDIGVWDRIVRADFHRHVGIHSKGRGESHFKPYGADDSGPWTGFQAPRERLDALLITACVDAGCTVLRPERVLSILQQNGRVIGVRSDQRELLAPWTCDALGDKHWLARQLRLVVDYHGPQRRVSFGWRSARDTDHHDPWIVHSAQGWLWEANLGNGEVAWAQLRSGAVGTGRDVTWRIVPQCAGPGYFLLGDAASVVDPSAGHGILKALMSGIHAVHGICSLRADGLEEATVESYRRWMMGLFIHDVRALRAQDRGARAHSG